MDRMIENISQKRAARNPYVIPLRKMLTSQGLSVASR